MSKSRFTPGPWVAITNPYVTAVECGVKTPVVNWQGFNGSDRPKAEHQANARLIAAAPDLLAACQAVININWPEHFKTFPPNSQEAEATRLVAAAIAKATGGKP